MMVLGSSAVNWVILLSILLARALTAWPVSRRRLLLAGLLVGGRHYSLLGGQLPVVDGYRAYSSWNCFTVSRSRSVRRNSAARRVAWQFGQLKFDRTFGISVGVFCQCFPHSGQWSRTKASFMNNNNVCCLQNVVSKYHSAHISSPGRPAQPNSSPWSTSSSSL